MDFFVNDKLKEFASYGSPNYLVFGVPSKTSADFYDFDPYPYPFPSAVFYYYPLSNLTNFSTESINYLV